MLAGVRAKQTGNALGQRLACSTWEPLAPNVGGEEVVGVIGGGLVVEHSLKQHEMISIPRPAVGSAAFDPPVHRRKVVVAGILSTIETVAAPDAPAKMIAPELNGRLDRIGRGKLSGGDLAAARARDF